MLSEATLLDPGSRSRFRFFNALVVRRKVSRWYDVLNRPHPVTGVPCKVWPMNWPVSQALLLNRPPVFWDTDR